MEELMAIDNFEDYRRYCKAQKEGGFKITPIKEYKRQVAANFPKMSGSQIKNFTSWAFSHK